jgi:putative glutamine amidotransferase
MEPLKIGVSARLLYPDSRRTFLPTKSVQYLEQSVANWVMSGEVLAFMIPEMSLATPHQPATKVKHYVDVLDGLLLQGGEDMSPQSYGEQPINPRWSGDEVRDRYEIELFHEFVTQGKPVFGICRGHQLINVALGGTLYQDIGTQCPDKLEHRNSEKYEHHFHEVRILPQTWLARIYPDVTTPKRINSIHHQAVKTLGEGLVVEALGEPDGMVEAMRWEGHCFVVGVQWHPEFMDPKDTSLIDSRPLLKAFITACEQRKKTGKPTPVMAVKAA